MKNETLFGEVKDGLFTPINPYSYTNELDEYISFLKFPERHPALPIFDTYGIPVKDAEKVEAIGPIYQYRGVLDDETWQDENENAYKVSFEEYPKSAQIYFEKVETRHVYKSVSDTPEMDTGLRGVKKLDTEYTYTAPLSDKSDVEGRARLNFPETPTNCQTHPNVHMHNNEQRSLQDAYIQGATDQEKLMQGERVRIDDVKNALNKWRQAKLSPMIMDDILTLIRNKQQ